MSFANFGSANFIVVTSRKVFTSITLSSLFIQHSLGKRNEAWVSSIKNSDSD